MKCINQLIFWNINSIKLFLEAFHFQNEIRVSLRVIILSIFSPLISCQALFFMKHFRSPCKRSLPLPLPLPLQQSLFINLHLSKLSFFHHFLLLIQLKSERKIAIFEYFILTCVDFIHFFF